VTVHTPPSRLVAASGPEDFRALPEEVPVALVYNGSTQAVMMATPADLEDFAVGFTLTEGIAKADEIGDLEIVEHGTGIEARIWLPEARAGALDARRRSNVGPVGCGLCGIDSLDQAMRPLPRLAAGGLRLTRAEARQGLDELRGWQPLHDETHAVHAAGFWQPGRGILLAREDVGRHNALDKLVGALARDGVDPSAGAIVLTSRVSVEMVQKAVMAGCAVLLAVSAPTAHAVRLAGDAGLTVATAARGQIAVFSHADRINDGASDAS
jgi:FdhD protein